MIQKNSTIVWLLRGDPAIRWQVLRDLLDADPVDVETERTLVAQKGWGARLLALQKPWGEWGGGIYSPKWTSTTYTMLLLRRMGLPSQHPQAQMACRLLLEKGYYHDGGINYSASIHYSETCITGMILSILSYFRYPDDRVNQLVEHLLDQQMKDGGWNCQSYKGATHSSFHTTISVLEGLREYERFSNKNTSEISEAQERGREFLLVHRLFRSHRTGEVVNSVLTRFSFPPRWHYDILRALDYFQDVRAKRDARLVDSIKIVKKKRKKDGCWFLQNRHPGRTHFELEKTGSPSRWNTFRALHVLRWWEGFSGIESLVE